MYSQNGEDLIISKYFGDYRGTLLSIGENDGTTFSNSRLLIERGWSAFLYEPDKRAYLTLEALYRHNLKVMCFNVGVSSTPGIKTFYIGGDSLLSTAKETQLKDFKNNKYEQGNAYFVTFAHAATIMDKVDYITIDAEGEDWEILQQINLTALGCRALVIESGNKPQLPQLFRDYCAQHEMFCIEHNGENMVFVKPK